MMLPLMLATLSCVSSSWVGLRIGGPQSGKVSGGGLSSGRVIVDKMTIDNNSSFIKARSMSEVHLGSVALSGGSRIHFAFSSAALGWYANDRLILEKGSGIISYGWLAGVKVDGALRLVGSTIDLAEDQGQRMGKGVLTGQASLRAGGNLLIQDAAVKLGVQSQTHLVLSGFGDLPAVLNAAVVTGEHSVLALRAPKADVLGQITLANFASLNVQAKKLATEAPLDVLAYGRLDISGSVESVLIKGLVSVGEGSVVSVNVPELEISKTGAIFTGRFGELRISGAKLVIQKKLSVGARGRLILELPKGKSCSILGPLAVAEGETLHLAPKDVPYAYKDVLKCYNFGEEPK